MTSDNQTASAGAPPARRTLHELIRPNRRARLIREAIVEGILLCCGLFSIVVTISIAWVLFQGAVLFFTWEQGSFVYSPSGRWLTPGETWERVSYFFVGNTWSAGYNPPSYGILPLVVGTMVVAAIAAAISLPVGLATAIYLSEYAPPRVRAIAKPTLEVLAGIPTVVYGFFAVTTLTPLLAILFQWAFGLELGNPYNQLSAGIVVGIMIIPMVASLSEDALRAVPRSLREGAAALGANKFETSLKVVTPAALSGIIASFLLAVSRAVGETMAVSLAAGDRSIPLSWESINPLRGLATMTSFIVRMAKGDVPVGTTDYNSLFAVAATLFVITLVMNFLAQKVMRRYRQVYQ